MATKLTDIFKSIFLNENDRIQIQISLKFVPRSQIDNKGASIVSGNGLAPNRRQAIIWIKADLIHLSIYSTLGGDGVNAGTWHQPTHTVLHWSFNLRQHWSFNLRHSSKNAIIWYPAIVYQQPGSIEYLERFLRNVGRQFMIHDHYDKWWLAILDSFTVPLHSPLKKRPS